MAWRSNTLKEVVVYASLSTNVWANLAFEDWVFRNVDLAGRRILYLWRNSPCVVIGRHQNPWQECNLPVLRESGVQLVRRRSGGGTVYHDLGNLNVTVFTHRSDYNRPRNLWLVASALNSRWNTQLQVNDRNDIICRERWKVSGSSSKLSKNSTYHHFTLLLDAVLGDLHTLLTPNPKLVVMGSKATQSQRSEVINLCSLYPTLTHASVCEAIAEEFYRANGVSGDREIVQVDPTSEEALPGITGLAEELRMWEWNYGKCPQLSVTLSEDFGSGNVSVEMVVGKGRIEECRVSVADTRGNTTDHNIRQSFSELQKTIIGCKLGRGDVGCQVPESLCANSVAIVEWLDSIF